MPETAPLSLSTTTILPSADAGATMGREQPARAAGSSAAASNMPALHARQRPILPSSLNAAHMFSSCPQWSNTRIKAACGKKQRCMAHIQHCCSAKGYDVATFLLLPHDRAGNLLVLDCELNIHPAGAALSKIGRLR